jgi:hypothetical protein
LDDKPLTRAIALLDVGWALPTLGIIFTKKGNSLTGNREWGMGNKKGRMPIPFDGDKEKKYIRRVAQPMPYGGLSFQSLPFQGHVMRVRKSPVPSSLFPVPL